MALPIALFVYNRPEHIQRTVDSLKSAECFEDIHLYIFSDAAKLSEDISKVEDVRQICREIKVNNFELIERSENYGLARNIIEGIGYIFNIYDEVVVLEDDIVVSPYFIQYFKSALSFYRGKNVFSISAYTPKIDIPKEYQFSTYFMMRNCSWGWATWKDKWENVDWQVADFDNFIVDRVKRCKFNECGTDLSPMLLRWRIGEINSWSIRFCYAAFKMGEPTVYPVVSLVQNCGVDGSGTNMKKSFKYDTQMSSYIDICNFAKDVQINEQIRKSFRKIYNTSLYRRTINMFKRWRYLRNNNK